MNENGKAPDIGWRHLQPSTARVTHYLNEEGRALCSPNHIEIVLTNAQIEAMPKIFPEQRVKKLRKLPVCTRCEARAAGAKSRNYMTLERDRLIDENIGLRKENQILKDRLAELTVQLAKASALIGR